MPQKKFGWRNKKIEKLVVLKGGAGGTFWLIRLAGKK